MRQGPPWIYFYTSKLCPASRFHRQTGFCFGNSITYPDNVLEVSIYRYSVEVLLLDWSRINTGATWHFNPRSMAHCLDPEAILFPIEKPNTDVY